MITLELVTFYFSDALHFNNFKSRFIQICEGGPQDLIGCQWHGHFYGCLFLGGFEPVTRLS